MDGAPSPKLRPRRKMEDFLSTMVKGLKTKLLQLSPEKLQALEDSVNKKFEILKNHTPPLYEPISAATWDTINGFSDNHPFQGKKLSEEKFKHGDAVVRFVNKCRQAV